MVVAAPMVASSESHGCMIRGVLVRVLAERCDTPFHGNFRTAKASEDTKEKGSSCPN